MLDLSLSHFKDTLGHTSTPVYPVVDSFLGLPAIHFAVYSSYCTACLCSLSSSILKTKSSFHHNKICFPNFV